MTSCSKSSDIRTFHSCPTVLVRVTLKMKSVITQQVFQLYRTLTSDTLSIQI